MKLIEEKVAAPAPKAPAKPAARKTPAPKTAPKPATTRRAPKATGTS